MRFLGTSILSLADTSFLGTINCIKNLTITNNAASASNTGGVLNLVSNDGAACGDDHRLGKLGFQAAEDASGTIRQGASIEAYADAAWSASENGTRLEFYTMDGNNGKELSLTLDSDKLATFTGAVTVTGALTGTLATVAQANITSLGTLTALDVDDINLNGKTITITGDTDDTFSMVTGAAGATTLTTTDNNAAAGHFEIAADGNITLDAAGDIVLEAGGNDITASTNDLKLTSSVSGKPRVTLVSTNTTRTTSGGIKFLKDAADVEDGEVIGELNFHADNDAGTPEVIQYGKIKSAVADMTDGQEAGSMNLQVASYDGVLENGLVLDGDTNADGEVDVTIATGAASVTTIAGTLTMGDTATITNAGLVAVANQSNITGVGTLSSGNATTIVDAASVSAAGKVELATTGEADTGTDAARAVTPAGLKSHVDARYTYQYIVFLCDSDAIVSNQFITPGANGISNHLWNDDSDLDYTGTDATTIGHANAHITMNFQMATASIIVPQACDLAGFYAVGRNESSQTNNFGIGMFVSEESDAAYGGTATWDATLRAFSLSDGTSRLDRAQKIDGMLTTPFAMTAGDLITPAVVAPTGNQVKTTITLVLRTKIA